MEIIKYWWTGVICWGVTLSALLICLPKYKENKKEFFRAFLNPVLLFFYAGAVVFTIAKGIVFTVIVIISVPVVVWLLFGDHNRRR